MLRHIKPLAMLCSLAAFGCSSTSEPIDDTPGDSTSGVRSATGTTVHVPTGTSMPFKIMVLDVADAPIGGAKVRFTTNSGVVSLDSTLTDSEGRAFVNWNVGAGANRSLVARAVLPGDTLTGTVDAEPFVPQRVLLTDRPYGMAVTSNGMFYVTRLDAAAVTVGSISTMTVSDTIAVGFIPTGVTFNPAQTEAYVTNQYSQNIGVIDVAAGAQVATIPIQFDPFVVTFAPNGTRAYVASNVGWVYAINTATRAVIDSVFTANGSNGAVVNAAGTKLFVSAFASDMVYEIDLASFDVIRSFESSGMPQALVLSPDGAELYVATQAGYVDVWSLSAWSRTDRITIPDGVFGLVGSADGSKLYVTSMSGWVSVMDRASRQVTESWFTGGDPRRIAVSTDGQRLAIANQNGWVEFIAIP